MQLLTNLSSTSCNIHTINSGMLWLVFVVLSLIVSSSAASNTPALGSPSTRNALHTWVVEQQQALNAPDARRCFDLVDFGRLRAMQHHNTTVCASDRIEHVTCMIGSNVESSPAMLPLACQVRNVYVDFASAIDYISVPSCSKSLVRVSNIEKCTPLPPIYVIPDDQQHLVCVYTHQIVGSE
jgi:hypothetical protein